MATTPSARSQAPSTANRYLYPGMKPAFILLVSCFAAWGLAGNMTDPLVKVFGSVFSMSALQSSLVQSAYYGAYFALAIPAAMINSRFGYKTGVVSGLFLAAAGGLLFIPAAQVMVYGVFLAALFTLAAGLSILETSANPFIMSMGPEHNATRRLNFAQAFNPIGSNLGVLFAAVLILPNVNPATAQQRAQLSQDQLFAVQSAELTAVMGPYVGLAVLYIALGVGLALAKVPSDEQEASALRLKGSRLSRLLTNRLYSFGVVAQYFNIAAQTCVWTYTLHYAADAIGANEAAGGRWLQASLLIFLVSRFGMVALMGRYDGRKLMLLTCTLGVFLSVFAMFSVNIVGLLAVISLSACLSLLFPTIYGVALTGLGEDTKFGAAGLVMAIIGGATMPLVQGRLIDVAGAGFSYVVPAVCFAVVLGYAVYSLKHQARVVR